MNGLILVTPPTAEPVALQTLKDHLRLNLDDEDALLAAYLTAARQTFENLTGRQLMTATWRMTLDQWPRNNFIYLPKPPLQVISSVRYLDQTWTATKYTVDTTREPGRIVANESWPGLATPGAVEVEFVAGYGSADQVPQLAKQAILLLASTYYQQRESVTEKNLYELPMGFKAIVAQYKHIWGL